MYNVPPPPPPKKTYLMYHQIINKDVNSLDIRIRGCKA